jgi:nucleoside-diphosphate-sugar epimerase
MAVLITGGCGFVGSNVAKVFAQRGIDCLRLDKRLASWDFLEPYDARIKTISGDVSNYNELLEIAKHYKIEGVVHLAAMKYDKDCKANPLLAFGVNVSSTEYVLEIARILVCAEFWWPVRQQCSGNGEIGTFRSQKMRPSHLVVFTQQ